MHTPRARAFPTRLLVPGVRPMSAPPSNGLIRLLLLLLLGFGGLSGVLAGPVDCGDRPITFAYYKYGFFYYEQDGQGRGFDLDLIAELTARTGCTFTAQVMPRARVWADLENGQLDMSAAGVQTRERDRFAWFVPYFITKNYVLIRAPALRTVHSAADFLAQPALIFGVVRGFKHGEAQDQWLEQLRRNARIEESAGIDVLLEKLKRGRIDGLFAQPPVYQKIIADLDLAGEVVVQDWFGDDPGIRGNLILAKSRFSAADAQRWQVLVRQLRDDGTLKRIFAAHMPATEAEQLLNF